ncbi:flavodoxin family protein [Paenibacillus sp. ACRSA]|uniref:flavodoxin family protein n=1 Tax=Paenibacillus sp. ACRSA TaxID=2918211 RepID=UPI001EF4CC38|nr:flavodoxin family protein [Paenibacillus sp. ACRSA]MCG7376115.1 flavodoxin family protein [Paenibacillus sp. ACRSA]
MKMLIHDLPEQQLSQIYNPTDALKLDVVTNNGSIRKCVGCFGCWTRTPGVCIIRDEYQHMGERLSKIDELIIVSECMYGSYSPFVLNVLNRSISYVLPYFVTKNGETHHKQRYKNRFALSVHFYGEDIMENEKETAKKLVAANSLNWASTNNSVFFHTHAQDVRGMLQ